MNINNIELPNQLVTELYSSSLVSDIDGTKNTAVSATTVPTSEDIAWKSLGDNQQNILIVVKNNNAVYLPDNELSFLTGILSACKLSLADVAIINLANYPNALYKELTGFYKSKIVLLFDVEPSQFGLPMSFPHYQIQPFTNNSFLFSPSLESLENNKLEKGKLWTSLKRLFNL